MRKISINKKYTKYIKMCLVITILAISSLAIYKQLDKENDILVSNINDEELEQEYTLVLQNLFDYRNKALLDKDENSLKQLYDIENKFGLWAYEHEVKKMQYLENWSSKQGVIFKDIKTKVKVTKVKEKEKDLYGIICNVSTDYKYSYENQKEEVNSCKIGTNHYLNVKVRDGEYIITKEWYTDPFADSLSLENIESGDIKKYILAKEKPYIELTNEQQKAVEYAHRYCGVSNEEEYEFKFNRDYKNFNPDGGDCANFASQIMYESGRFKKNQTWNYEDRQGTKAWVNAQAFKNYIIYSGRGNLITKGTYKEVYKDAYNMKPGDFVAYEKGGRITHVSTVTGVDSRGYPLVTCHNTDRLLVPWDLGWSNKSIKFHFINVYY